MDSSSFFSGLVAGHSTDIVEFFIDRDPTYFRHVLNWLRGVRYIPEDRQVLQELLHEADYYRIESLVLAIRNSSPPKTVTCSLDLISHAVGR
jgi:hypothetical protein